MNINDNQFDDFLRSQFEGKTFEQKDHYWKNAQQMIQKHHSVGSKGAFNMVVSAVVFVTLSVGLLWNSASTPSVARQDNKITASNNQQNAIAIKATTIDAQTPLAANNQQPVSADMNVAITNAANIHQPTEGSSNTMNVPVTKRNRQQQLTRKSALANIQTQQSATQESVVPTTTTEPEMINSRFYRPLKGAQYNTNNDGRKDQYLAYAVNQQKSFVAIEGGINAYNNQGDLMGALNMHAGVRYYRFLSPKLAMSAGLTYSRLNQNIDTRTYQNIEYSFGQNSTQTTLTTKRIDYLEIPVSAYYKISGNHYVNAGAVLAYAIQSNNYVESNGSNSYQNGYLDAINRFDVQLNIGYTYFINQRYNISAGYYVGLTDISNNAVFNNNKFDRNNGIRLTLGYKLF